MFTGIVSDIGRVEKLTEIAGGVEITMACHYPLEQLEIGQSIACDGICFTITGRQNSQDKDYSSLFTFQAWQEALNLTTVKDWQPGLKVNLELSLRWGGQLGGHLLLGHVDNRAKIIAMLSEGRAIRFIIEPPQQLMAFIAPKGCVALNGTSLTINEVTDGCFDVLLIEHSLQVTNWGEKRPGDEVNIEIDYLARYNAQFHYYQRQKGDNGDNCRQISQNQSAEIAHPFSGADRPFLIINAPYYKHISQRLLGGAVKFLTSHNAPYEIIEVPGALEIPPALAITLAKGQNYAGYIALGCIIRGATYHFDIVANESAHALMELAINHKLALGNGILTVENEEQALARSEEAIEHNKGYGAAQAAWYLAQLKQQYGGA